MSNISSRRCPDPLAVSGMNLSDYERLLVRCRRSAFLRMYLEFKSGHISTERWKRKKRARIFHVMPETENRPVTIPPRNLELLAFLDSLPTEVQENDEAWERLERSIDENRLSSRRFFT